VRVSVRICRSKLGGNPPQLRRRRVRASARRLISVIQITNDDLVFDTGNLV
jgi:hypothetical protein